MKTTTAHVTRITAVALATAALCWHQAAHAATEAELRSIKLYGNVSIQEDSTSSWGPWTEFEPPAAGTTQPVVFRTGTPDPYRPLAQTGNGPTTPQPPAAEPGCAAGGLCGFGAFQASSDPNNEGIVEAIHPIRMDGTILQPAGSESPFSYLPESIELNTTALSTGTFLLPNSGTLDLQTDKGVSYQRRETGDTFFRFIPDTFLASYYDPAEVQATLIVLGNLGTYVQGSQQQQQQQMWGVIGYATSADQMASLRASNAQARYIGNDYYNNLGVEMTVNFGNASWTGTWNGGRDGAVQQYSTADGGTVLKGAVGFTAAGTVQGVNFSSTSVGTLDAGATVTGYVKGAFYGPNAAAAGGVADIVKTMPGVQQQQPASAGRATAQAVGQGYTNGRYVAPFLAVRSDLIRNRD